MEGKKTGVGAGVLILIVAAIWFLGKKPAIAAPGSPSAYDGTIYEGMTQDEAWAYYNQLKAEREAKRAAAIAEMEAWIADPEKVEAEGLAELGITRAELPTYQEFALTVNIGLGGSYVNGVLTPPASWTGSVTEWSRYVQRVTNIRYHEMYG